MGSISPDGPFQFCNLWKVAHLPDLLFVPCPITLLTVTKTGEKATREGHRDYGFLNHLYFMKYEKAL